MEACQVRSTFASKLRRTVHADNSPRYFAQGDAARELREDFPDLGVTFSGATDALAVAQSACCAHFVRTYRYSSVQILAVKIRLEQWL